MKNVKTLGIILAVSLFLGGYVYTQAQLTAPEQPGGKKSPTVDEMVQRLKTDLNLTQQQADAVKSILKQFTAKRKELRETLRRQGADSDTLLRSQMESLSQEQGRQLSKILSQDQMDKMQAIAKEMWGAR